MHGEQQLAHPSSGHMLWGLNHPGCGESRCFGLELGKGA